MDIFGEIERPAADLYPYRWPITIGLLIVGAAVVWIAFRAGWHRVVLRHKVVSAVFAVAFVAVAIPAVNYFLSPLWERSTLNEASPLAEAAAPATSAQTSNAPPTAPPQVEEPPSFEARVVRSGDISGADDFHFGEGTALLIETAPDTYTLRFEEFSVRNGPDLFVYLTPDQDSVEGALNLGNLKATDGAFNYEVPAGTDVSRYQYAVVWCRDFAVLFASASLSPA